MTIAHDEYARRDALGLAALVRDGEVSPADLLEAAIARAEAVNPAINAIAARLYDQARAAAPQAWTGPFAGVPFAMKDLNHPVAGAPFTQGSRVFARQVATHDGEGTRRFRAAGLNIFATSTTPEFALAVTTESALFGATRNPWDLSRSAGGSSGGAAALVAAGVIPMAHATDGGGSIRVPASCCGLFGLKPSRGRTPVGDGRTEGWGGLTTSFAVTRSVRDAAHLLDAVHGPEPGSRTTAPPPHGRFAHALDQPPPRLRIAVAPRAPNGAGVHADCLGALDAATRLLEGLGHRVGEAAPALDAASLGIAGVRVVGSYTAAALDAAAQARGRPIGEDEVEPVTAALVAAGRACTATELIAADQAFMSAAIAMARFLEDWDLLLTPTLAQPPAMLGAVSLSIDPARYVEAFGAYCPFTAIANQTGQPAMSVPLHWSASHLPIGVQFCARIGEEQVLLALAAELEQAAPWAHRRPTL